MRVSPCTVASACAALPLLTVAPVAAQTSPGSTTADSLQEVVVTATRREER